MVRKLEVAYLHPNTQRMLKPRGGRVRKKLQRKITKITETFNGDTQKVRGQLILDLKALAEIAYEQASKRSKKGGKWMKEHGNWARLAAYISQVINSIGKTYDIIQIKAELDELWKMVAELDKQ